MSVHLPPLQCASLPAMWFCLLAAFALLGVSDVRGQVSGITYHVDYDSGSDQHDGRSPQQAFRHSPGDPAATGNAATTLLKPGDVVRFRGGVNYRGMIDIRWSGAQGAPIVFDGNTDGTWGEGRAIVDGSDPVTGWQRVASQAEARGNPNWQNLYWARVPADADVSTVNLIQNDQLMSIARDPSPSDPFFVDELRTMRPIRPPLPRTEAVTEIRAPGLIVNASHPLHILLDGAEQTFAIVDPMEGAKITFALPQPMTAQTLVISGHTRSTRARDIAFIADGREILKATMKQEGGRHEFRLDRPVTFRELTLEIRSVYGGQEHKYGAVRYVQALDRQGRNVLTATGGEPHTAYADPTYFTHRDPDAFKGAYFAIWAQPNRVYYQRVLGYDPQKQEIRFEALQAAQYEGDRGRFAIVNAISAITERGEYYISPDVEEDGTKRVYAWPLESGPDGPQGMTISRRENLFNLANREHIVIQGFIIQKQGGNASHAIYGRTGVRHLTIRDNEIRFGQSVSRDSVIAIVHGEHIRIENNYLHHNRNARGFRLTVNDSVVTGNRLHRNGSTGIGFFGSKRSEMTYNTVTGHTGVHANSLTVYADSEDILVEGNLAYDGNIPLTLQNSANVTVRNNVLINPSGVVIGIWTGWHRNLRIEHNALLGADRGPDWAAGVFTNSNDIDGLHVHNNIMAGSSGTLPGQFSHNIFTRVGQNDDAAALGEGSMLVEDLRRLFVDPEGMDFRPRPDSPAINAGHDVGVGRDIRGTSRPQGPAPDIGPYEYSGE